MAADEGLLREWDKETRLAKQVVVASSFTKASLVNSGVHPERVAVVPYGTDLDRVSPQIQRASSGPMRVLFVGSKVARKGLHTLLEAWQRLRPRFAVLRLAGGGARDQRILDSFPRVATELGRLTPTDLVAEFQQADLFVMPSIAEGFGHVYLEALAAGTPFWAPKIRRFRTFLRKAIVVLVFERAVSTRLQLN